MKIYLIIIIVLLLVINCGGSREHFSTMIDLDAITFGKVHPNWQKISQRKVTEFPLPLPLTKIPKPTKNSSIKTMKEIAYLKKLNKDISADKIELAKRFYHYRDVLNFYLKYAGENRLMYSEKYIKRAYRDVLTLAVNMQLLFNRPRPVQLAYYNSNYFHVIGNAPTPSYPCASVLIAEVLNGLFAYNNPNQRENLEVISQNVELSRLYAGLNYPSDIKVAKDVAKIVLKHIKRLEFK